MKFNILREGAYALLVGALGCAPNLTNLKINNYNFSQHYNNIIQKEPYTWNNIKEYDYAGKLTQREEMSNRIKELAETGEKFDKKDIEAIILAMDDNVKCNFFIENDGSSYFAFENFVNPTPSELKDYDTFVNKFHSTNLKDLDLIKRVYENFQTKVGGVESNKLNGEGWGYFSNDKPLHPAVLLSKREKGVCADKAFALYDIYTKLGIKTKLITGDRIGGTISHMWVRVYRGDESFDLDPTLYDQFTLLERK